MIAIEKQRRIRKPEVIELEIHTLENLISKRNTWLNEPVNLFKRTYMAVKLDTEEMEADLRELKEEFNKLTN